MCRTVMLHATGSKLLAAAAAVGNIQSCIAAACGPASAQEGSWTDLRPMIANSCPEITLFLSIGMLPLRLTFQCHSPPLLLSCMFCLTKS